MEKLCNRKALYDYFVLEELEAGIVLQGSEIKSIRNGRVNLKDSFCKFVKDELFVFGMYISLLSTTYMFHRPDETRPRKLLLHRKQLDKWFGRLSKEGLTIIPLDIHFVRGRAKLQLGLCKGKKKYDKREAIKKRDLERASKIEL